MGKGHKVWPFETLTAELKRVRTDERRIVHCHGVFDLLHVGHIRHFEQARQFGDILVVTVTPDRYVNKGVNRPAFPELLRAEVVASLASVDYVAINRWPTAVEAIHLLRPHVFVKGSEYREGNDSTGHISVEEEAIRNIGGEMAFTRDITFSSSALINQYLPGLNEEVREYLNRLSFSYTASDILQHLRAASGARVLVVGETIIDDYQYCEAIGKAGKEPVLVTRHLSADRFAGGALACANHLAGFSKGVDVLTFLGAQAEEEVFLRSRLKQNVTPIFFRKPNSPTITKKRFIEKYLSQKLFEVYYINDEPLGEDEDAEFCQALETRLPNYDLVVVADYGHGMLSARSVKLLCERSRFLAVNTQSNAGNNGFNTISKYPRADYVCLAHREFALETRNRRLSPEEMVLDVAHRLSCPRVMLTQGKYGSLFYHRNEGFQHAPAFTTSVVDRVGAGDAVLSITALCAVSGAPGAAVVFLGNVVGAQAVNILGNQSSIERIPLYRHVECLLKTHRSDGDNDVQPMKPRLAA